MLVSEILLLSTGTSNISPSTFTLKEIVDGIGTAAGTETDGIKEDNVVESGSISPSKENAGLLLLTSNPLSNKDVCCLPFLDTLLPEELVLKFLVNFLG